MQHRGLISRERCRTDQRGAVVAITGRGSNLIEAAAPQHVRDVRDVLIDHVTTAELETLVTIGTKVHDRLFALGKGGVGFSSWLQRLQGIEARRCATDS